MKPGRPQKCRPCRGLKLAPHRRISPKRLVCSSALLAYTVVRVEDTEAVGKARQFHTAYLALQAAAELGFAEVVDESQVRLSRFAIVDNGRPAITEGQGAKLGAGLVR